MATKINGQILIYPMKEATIGAGFLNPKYPTDKDHPFNHFGHDYCTLGNDDFDTIASGNGTVLNIEKNTNSLGCIAVIKYDNVYIPSQKRCKDLILRYIHMATISVKKGDIVKPYQTLGRVWRKHKWWNHVHVEIDVDTAHPYHTCQVREESSVLLRGSKTYDTMLNPVDVFVIGKNQTAIVHPLAVYATNVDKPKYKESDFIVSNTGGVSTINNNANTNYQKLILPIDKCYITASKGMPSYYQRFGFVHYGVDMTSSVWNTQVYASGNGIVLETGFDNIFGNTVIIKYPNVLNHITNKIQDVVFRYFHGASILVQKGQTVNANTKIMMYGQTGKYPVGSHLHLSADYDCNLYQYEAGLKYSGNIIKKGNDKTMFNPMEVLHCKTSSPDKQSISGDLDGTYNGLPYVNKSDLNIPKII